MQSIDYWPIEFPLELGLLVLFTHSLPELWENGFEELAVSFVTQLSLIDYGVIRTVEHVAPLIHFIGSFLLSLYLFFFVLSLSLF